MKALSQKIFIIGLPRTATTSICEAFLQLGYKTAHTAYTKACFEQATVIADTPVFADFKQLDSLYPNAKFIYLDRSLTDWLPSIKQLLLRMEQNITRADGGFNLHIKRVYQEIFAPFTLENIQSDDFLKACYLRHQKCVFSYFNDRLSDFISINISEKESINTLHQFLGLNIADTQVFQFRPLNIAGKVTAWTDIKHPLKIASTRNGKIDKRIY